MTPFRSRETALMADRPQAPRPTGAGPRYSAMSSDHPLITLGTIALVVACLYWGRAVFIPIALAGLLTFLLSPLVNALYYRRLGRPAAVLVVVFAALCVAGTVGWAVTRQLGALASELPRYRDNIHQRIADIRGLGTGGSVQSVQQTLKEVVREIEKGGGPPPKPGRDAPAPVTVEPPTSPLSHLPRLFDALAAAGVVLVLVIFMLLEQHELRDRLIRLIGPRRVTVTTRALDETEARISRYLLMQSIVNGSLGFTFGLVLFLLGVPYAALWGFLLAALRFIPYVGAPVAALLPITIALAVFPGWTRPLAAFGAFVALECIANVALEPWLYGQSAGISQVALLVAVLFWTWLWGPIGLLLATPLTVCLIVLSKHLPALGFLIVLMGDEPVLEPRARYYQRLLARDQDGAAKIVEEYLKVNAPETLYDEVLLPALYYANLDGQRDQIEAGDSEFVVEATWDILEELTQNERFVEEIAKPDAGKADTRPLLLMCPARDRADEVALGMLEDLVPVAHYRVENVGVPLLTSEVTQLVAERQPAVLCIGSVGPGGVSHIRHLCKRVRARCPDLKLVAGRWALEEDSDERRELTDAGADRVALSILESQRYLAELGLLTAPPPRQPEEENPSVSTAPALPR